MCRCSKPPQVVVIHGRRNDAPLACSHSLVSAPLHEQTFTSMTGFRAHLKSRQRAGEISSEDAANATPVEVKVVDGYLTVASTGGASTTAASPLYGAGACVPVAVWSWPCERLLGVFLKAFVMFIVIVCCVVFMFCVLFYVFVISRSVVAVRALARRARNWGFCNTVYASLWLDLRLGKQTTAFIITSIITRVH